MPKLSVVVPLYNVEAYLPDALASVVRQTLPDFEVIMVDDASTDGTAAIAKWFAASDPRFRLLQQEHRGQGPARNLAVQHATGDYLAFLDGDDVLPPNAYNLLVGSLEKTGSDIGAGGIRRFSSGWISQTGRHGKTFPGTVERTSISRYPALVRDPTVWNKVFRRSFWDAAGLEFWSAPNEDIPVAIGAYALARAVDLRREIVYYWRARESGELSRRQKAREPARIQGRIAAISEARRLIARHAPAAKAAFDRRMLDYDLTFLIDGLECVAGPARQRLLDQGTECLRSVHDSVLRQLPVPARLEYYLLREGRHHELLDVLRYAQRGDAAAAPLVRRGRLRRTWYVGYPYFDDSSRPVPRYVYDATAELRPQVRLESVGWHEGKLRIEGHAYVSRLDASRSSDVRLGVRLRNHVLRRTRRLKVERVRRPDVTAQAGEAVCYDWSGFVAEIDPARLSNLGTWRAASWELRVKVSGRGIRGEGPVTSVAPGTAQWPESRWVADGVRIQPAPEPDGFVIRAYRPEALVTACETDGSHLRIEGRSAVALRTGAAVVAAVRQGAGEAVVVPATAIAGGSAGSGFLAVLPVAELLRTSGTRHGPALPGGTGERAVAVGDETHWDFALDTGAGRRVRLAAEPGVPSRRIIVGGEEISTYVTAFGNLSAVQRRCRLIVRQASWTPAGSLMLHGDAAGSGPRPGVIRLRGTGTPSQHNVPLRWAGDTFVAHLSPGSMPGPAGDLPLASGRWELLAQTADDVTTPVVADHVLLTHLPAVRQVGEHEVVAESYRGDALRLRVRRCTADVGPYGQRKLREQFRSSVARGAADDVVVFDSSEGRQYSGNPRAIYEELRSRDTGLECVWVTDDGQFRLPDGGRIVARDSREHYEVAARARALVANMPQPDWYSRPARQVYLQTWHGTPLKRIGLDIDAPQFEHGLLYHDRLRKDGANWSALLSANSFSTAVFRRALGFDGDILEFGYPRNDLLSSQDRVGRAEQIRRQLGIPAGQRIVLYAPTWRDDAPARAYDYGFPPDLDFGSVAQAMGHDAITVVRAHPKMADPLVAGVTGDRVIDVTSYPDMADLLLIADVLITDYSSAMFDFALTGRPMLFFTYDIDRYRDRLRGFYFDFAAEAPGPLLRTGDDLIDALRNLGEISRSYLGAYEAFAAKFCGRPDGKAAARTVDWLVSAVSLADRLGLN